MPTRASSQARIGLVFFGWARFQDGEQLGLPAFSAARASSRRSTVPTIVRDTPASTESRSDAGEAHCSLLRHDR